ncbi:hypothetical protein GJW-30_1_02357 [Variibacter gotjawalensis]|uniref:Anti-sigma factor NepR domain-containing protein n=1 Tax=Variibacter gotjawalensis TaxID=1333996 RepID=A0A0S3PV33_9BRAD|nr:NepR family anti-sigma factor [Variibacter gotjawalensis]NIK50150.1 hypothetical protein [Variibacter gotjawalensis]RZS46146.1 hypothetical protein EV661_4477 [Variibacter gotjawalensis]BAT59823.1 hypothetical protein GJW-30_1_02357 [Variibacter gotjawalensis]
MQNRKASGSGSGLKDTEVGSSNNKVALGRDVQAKIGENLRALYDDVVSQGVPDRFAELLKQLDKSDGGGERA